MIDDIEVVIVVAGVSLRLTFRHFEVKAADRERYTRIGSDLLITDQLRRSLAKGDKSGVVTIHESAWYRLGNLPQNHYLCQGIGIAWVVIRNVSTSQIVPPAADRVHS